MVGHRHRLKLSLAHPTFRLLGVSEQSVFEIMPPVCALLRHLALPAIAAAALAACDASTAISNPDISYSYRSIALGRFHGGDNALRVVVYGNPFDDPPEQVANAIVAGMQGHNGGPRMTFSAAAAPPPKPRWRVVMAINPVDFSNTLAKAGTMK